MSGRIRLLTPTEAERIQGFPTDHTKYCLVKDKIIEKIKFIVQVMKNVAVLFAILSLQN